MSGFSLYVVLAVAVVATKYCVDLSFFFYVLASQSENEWFLKAEGFVFNLNSNPGLDGGREFGFWVQPELQPPCEGLGWG